MKRLLLLLFFPIVCFAQGARFDTSQSPVMRNSGPYLTAVSGALVTVCTASGVGTPCSPKATIYSDLALTQVLANPLIADANGNYFFVASPAQTYFITVQATGVSSYSFYWTAPLVGAASVTFTNATINGNLTATAGQNNIDAFLFNGVRYIDGTKYPATCAGIQSALADALAGPPNIVDARGVPSITCSSEMDIGDGTHPVMLLVPSISGSWTSNVSDGVHAGFKVFNLSAVASTGGMCGAGIQFQLIGSSTFNGTNVFLTDPGTRYTHLQGFSAALNAGGTVTSAIGEFQGWNDNSKAECVNVTNNQGTFANAPKVGYIHGMCCNVTFANVGFEGQNGATGATGSVPLTIGNGAEFTQNLLFIGLNAVHPANAKNNIVITGSGTQQIHFVGNVYMESTVSGSDLTTPMIQIQSNAGSVFIDGARNGADNASETRYIVDNAAGSGSLRIFGVTNGVGGNCINDHVTGITITGCISTVKGLDTTQNTLTLGGVNNAAGLQIFNTTTTCTTGASIGATCTTAAITLPVAEADTSYRTVCTGKGVTNVPVVVASTNSSASQFTITIAALTAAAASFASYDCQVGHN